MKRITTILAACGLTLLVACDTGDDLDTELDPGLDTEAGQEAAPAPIETPAPPTGAVTLQVDTLEGAGAYITDAQGRAVYLLEADEEGESTCYDACAQAWPPVIAQQGQPSAGAQGLDASLLGTIERRDGQQQVTYSGHPLYYFAQDQSPGQTTGQDVHDEWGEWYLVTPEGEPLEGGAKTN